MKFLYKCLPISEIFSDLIDVLYACLKRVFVVLDFIATTASRNAIVFSQTSSSSNRNEMLDNLVFTATVSTAPLKIIKCFNPLFDCDCYRKVVLSGSESFTKKEPCFSIVFSVVTAFLADSVFCASTYCKEWIAANFASFLVFIKHPFSTSRMIETSQKARNVVKPKMDHTFDFSGTMAIFTKLLSFQFLAFRQQRQITKYPFPRISQLAHCMPQRKSPFASRCSAKQRGRFNCISDLLATPSNSVNRDYTMKLEQVYL